MTWLRIVTVLDLRFKDLKGLHRPKRVEVWSSVHALLREGRSAQPEQSAKSEPPKKKAALIVASESDSDEKVESIEKCVERYRAKPAIGRKNCPLQWWSEHEGAHSRLACLEHKCLATPATSVPCERLFSLSGHSCAEEGSFPVI